ncbi:hypothetical protein CJ255_13350 [Candidatus Viridilinea mediisalina]|uniref:Uncharacterized protein n=1 Tax=Candidatus Viridilinea mediisalina TaxID=2024553 RepID=A0A2A6RHW5_9CHLR|nr:hypothetical protein CJ255_13350 [Candidatus Viridilinea mediisalina]
MAKKLWAAPRGFDRLSQRCGGAVAELVEATTLPPANPRLFRANKKFFSSGEAALPLIHIKQLNMCKLYPKALTILTRIGYNKVSPPLRVQGLFQQRPSVVQ